jgi:hypothetical protein
MRVSCFLVALAVALIIGACSDEPHYFARGGPGPQAIPPPPRHPKIEGRVEAVSAADIREVIRLEQQDMIKRFGRPLPIYTVRIHSKNHVEVQFWEPDGIELWRDARRVKGKWKFDELVPGIVS